MKKINLHHKKIGIWGLGIVGKSVLAYVQQFTNQIQLMDQYPANASIIQESPENIAHFLQDNDIIIPSPGIILHPYQNYAHKFVQELDIFTQEFCGNTIAITGTVGKTTVTSLLAQSIPNSKAVGNIGYPMLNALKADSVILELSSYQLQHAKNFAPDLAIWTNFYPNHLDHHADEEEYFIAKCNILKHQTKHQIALLPYDLIDKIKQVVTPKAQIYLFDKGMDPRLPPTPLAMADSDAHCPPKLLGEGWKDEEKKKSSLVIPVFEPGSSQQTINYPTFYLHNNQLLLHHNHKTQLIFDNFHQLPDITFAQNWMIILATLHLANISLQNFATFTQNLKPEPHRLELVKTLHGVQIYNDSKSTVWQATKLAVDKFENKRIALFLGGISKGTDRTPLIESLQDKNVTVFAFGKESGILENLCKKSQIPHWCASTLQEALSQYLAQQKNFDVLLFSPAGASFDLFKNFEDRGTQFKKIICNL